MAGVFFHFLSMSGLTAALQAIILNGNVTEVMAGKKWMGRGGKCDYWNEKQVLPFLFSICAKARLKMKKEFLEDFLMVILMSFGFCSFLLKSKNDLFQFISSEGKRP